MHGLLRPLYHPVHETIEATPVCASQAASPTTYTWWLVSHITEQGGTGPDHPSESLMPTLRGQNQNLHVWKANKWVMSGPPLPYP